MPSSNDALAAILERGRPEEDADAVLAALVDGGVQVPFDQRGSVVFIGVDDTGPVLPGYTSEEDRQRLLPDAVGSMHCDAPRLLDIAKHTGVGTLVVFGGPGWVKVPLRLVAATLSGRGFRTQGERTLRLAWSTHPVAVALRDAFAARALAAPWLRTVWIADARWIDSGDEQLMVYLAVDEGARPAAQALLETVLAEDVPLSAEAPAVALQVLEPDEADRAAELDGFGLDSVRADHTAGRVQIVSQEFD